MKHVFLGLLGAAAVLTGAAALAQTISGAGATFPYPIYAKWASAYQQETGIRLNYQSIGSGGGIAQIKARTVTFGATDAPLSGDDLEELGLVQWPMVMGGIVPIVNLPDIKAGELVLNGEILAKIYLGDITHWNDPAIKALNPDVELPKFAIAVIHRSDGSGTTYNFTYYLGAVSPDWKTRVGVAKAVQWPTGLGAKGNEGVAGNVRQTRGSIGYVEYAYAEQNGMIHADMINAEGKEVEPTAEAFAAAAESADWSGTPGYAVILANQPGDGTWPMTAATFILMPKKADDADAARQALDFFVWSYAHGDEMALELHYVPMPGSVSQAVMEMWADEITGPDGTTLYPGTNND